MASPLPPRLELRGSAPAPPRRDSPAPPSSKAPPLRGGGVRGSWIASSPSPADRSDHDRRPSEPCVNPPTPPRRGGGADFSDGIGGSGPLSPRAPPRKPHMRGGGSAMLPGPHGGAGGAPPRPMSRAPPPPGRPNSAAPRPISLNRGISFHGDPRNMRAASGGSPALHRPVSMVNVRQHGQGDMIDTSNSASPVMPARNNLSMSGPVAVPASLSLNSSTDSLGGDVDGGEKRLQIVSEIVNTERDYLHNLDVLVNVFMFPMGAMNICSAEEISHMFSNVEVLYGVNKEMSETMTQRWEESGETDILLGDIFKKMADYLKMYTVYCSNQPRSTKTFDECNKRPQFKQFLNVCQSDTKCRGLMLGSFLIMPIQRVLKYPLLLRELCKRTPEDHADYALLAEAREKIDGVAAYINEGQRTSEGQRKVVEIQDKFDGLLELASPSRRYVREGTITHAKKERSIFLFNDLVLIAAAKKGKGDRLESKFQYKLDDTKLVNLADEKNVKHAFELSNSANKKCVLSCADEQDKMMWTKEIRLHIKEYQKKKLAEMKQERDKAAKR